MTIERINVEGLKGYAKSEIGGRSENQDSYGWAESPWGTVFTVCDGMGGGPAGKTASSIAVEQILEAMGKKEGEATLAAAVESAIKQANAAVYQKAMSDPALQGMGTTCTVLVLNDGTAVAAHVGDSRIYQLRGKNKKFRTFDHSMVFELVKQKVITEEQARTSAQSNVITRALGLADQVEVEVSELKYKSKDRFVLSTDGIHGTMPEKELLERLTDHKTPAEQLVNTLSQHVNQLGEAKGGGHDNNTIVLVEVENVTASQGWLKSLWKRIFGLAALATVAAGATAQTVEWKLAPQYDRLEPYGGNVWLATKDGQQLLVDVDMKEPFTHGYDSITRFSEERALGLQRRGNKWIVRAVISKVNKGERQPAKTWYALDNSCFSEGLLPVADAKGKQGYLNDQAGLAIKCQYNKVGLFHKGVAQVDKKGKLLYINRTGGKASIGDYQEIDVRTLTGISGKEDRTLKPVKRNGLWGYTRGGEDVVMPQFESAGRFWDGSAVVGQHGQVGLIELGSNPLKASTKTVKTGKKTSTDYLVVTTQKPVSAEQMRVTLKENGITANLTLEKTEGNAYYYALPARKGDAVASVYYNILLQDELSLKRAQPEPTVNKPDKPDNKPTAATLSLGSVSKKNAKADPNGNEYLSATITNTSAAKFTGTATIYVDGTPYTTSIKDLAPKKSRTISATVKNVKKERHASVYVKASNGQKSTTQRIVLKPFY